MKKIVSFVCMIALLVSSLYISVFAVDSNTITTVTVGKTSEGKYLTNIPTTIKNSGINYAYLEQMASKGERIEIVNAMYKTPTIDGETDLSAEGYTLFGDTFIEYANDGGLMTKTPESVEYISGGVVQKAATIQHPAAYYDGIFSHYGDTVGSYTIATDNANAALYFFVELEEATIISDIMYMGHTSAALAITDYEIYISNNLDGLFGDSNYYASYTGTDKNSPASPKTESYDFTGSPVINVNEYPDDNNINRENLITSYGYAQSFDFSQADRNVRPFGKYIGFKVKSCNNRARLDMSELAVFGEAAVNHTVNFVNTNACDVEIVSGNPQSILSGSSISFKVNSGDNNVSVKSGDEEISPDNDNIYWLNNIDSDLEVTISTAYDNMFIDSEYDLNAFSIPTYTEAFWKGDTAYHEAAVFNDGKATTFNYIDKLLSVKNEDLSVNYIYGKDYILENGALKLVDGSSINGTVYVSYYHSTSVLANFPVGSLGKLNGIEEKLFNGEKLKVCFYNFETDTVTLGDWISKKLSSDYDNDKIQIIESDSVVEADLYILSADSSSAETVSSIRATLPDVNIILLSSVYSEGQSDISSMLNQICLSEKNIAFADLYNLTKSISEKCSIDLGDYSEYTEKLTVQAIVEVLGHTSLDLDSVEHTVDSQKYPEGAITYSTLLDKSKLPVGAQVIEYGTLLIPRQHLTEDELTVNSKGAVAAGYKSDNSDEIILRYTTVFENTDTINPKAVLLARSFCKYSLNGEIYVDYSDCTMEYSVTQIKRLTAQKLINVFASEYNNEISDASMELWNQDIEEVWNFVLQEFSKPEIINLYENYQQTLVNACDFLNNLSSDSFANLSEEDKAIVSKRNVVSRGDSTRFARLMRKALRGEEINIVTLGGSITQGSGGNLSPDGSVVDKYPYVMGVADWFRTTFNTTVNLYNVGIGGTTSNFGVMRLESDVFSHEPDMVIIEFAVNDAASGYSDSNDYTASYESLLRQCLNYNSDLAVVSLYMSNRIGTSSQEAQHKIASYYNVPEISYKDAFNNLYDFASMSNDGTHPNHMGHCRAAYAINSYLTNVLNTLEQYTATTTSPVPNELYSDKDLIGLYIARADVTDGNITGFKKVNGFDENGNILYQSLNNCSVAGEYILADEEIDIANTAQSGYKSIRVDGNTSFIINNCKDLYFVYNGKQSAKGVTFTVTNMDTNEVTTNNITQVKASPLWTTPSIFHSEEAQNIKVEFTIDTPNGDYDYFTVVGLGMK